MSFEESVRGEVAGPMRLTNYYFHEYHGWWTSGGECASGPTRPRAGRRASEG